MLKSDNLKLEVHLTKYILKAVHVWTSLWEAQHSYVDFRMLGVELKWKLNLIQLTLKFSCWLR